MFEIDYQETLSSHFKQILSEIMSEREREKKGKKLINVVSIAGRYNETFGGFLFLKHTSLWMNIQSAVNRSE